jgi:ankyrin repeat protein
VERLVGQDPGLLDNKDYLLYDRTPLMWASHAGQLEVVGWLFDRGAAINDRDRYGETALSLARGSSPVVKFLLRRGADPTIADTRGRTPLMEASVEWAHLETVRCLLDHPGAAAALDQRCRQGRTARGGPATGAVGTL